MNKDENKELSVFHWPSREHFESEKEAFLDMHFGSIKKQLLKAGLDRQIIDRLAETVGRVIFVYNFMLQNIPVSLDTPTDIIWEEHFPSESISGASTQAVFTSGEGKVLTAQDALSLLRDGDVVTLSEIKIHMNLPYIIKRIKLHEQMFRRYVEWKKEGKLDEDEERFDPREEADKDEEEDIVDHETTIVEEIAHALFFQSQMQSSEKALRLFTEFLSYKGEPSEEIKQVMGIFFPTEEQVAEFHKHYTDTPVELRAAFWVRSFLNAYYPESNQRRLKNKFRESQKVRMRKRNSRE